MAPIRAIFGDYASANRCDDDNPAAPDWYKARCQSDPAGTQPLVIPRPAPPCRAQATTQTASSASTPRPWIPPGITWTVSCPAVTGRARLPCSASAWRGLHRSRHRQTRTSGLPQRRHSSVPRHGGGCDSHRYLETHRRDELLTYVHDWQAHKPGCSSLARTWSRAPAGALSSPTTTPRR